MANEDINALAARVAKAEATLAMHNTVLQNMNSILAAMAKKNPNTKTVQLRDGKSVVLRNHDILLVRS